ncbi:MAG: Crp/Fnr family transcriptional regulator [Bacteroidota bacterium]
MHETLFSYLEQLVSLSSRQKELLNGILIDRSWPAASMVLEEGAIAQSLLFITRGGMRSYKLRDGEDLTDYFFFETDFATDYASLYSGRPTRFFLETLEPTEALEIRRTDLLALGQEDPFFETFGRLMAEQAFVEIEARLQLFHHENLEVRLRWLLHQFPQLFQRVPQYHIASYLGVKPESLSRIKKMVIRDL